MQSRILNFELVPEPLFYKNLRYILPNWAYVSNKVRRSGYCLICGRSVEEIAFDYEYNNEELFEMPLIKGKYLEAHETWVYDDNKHIQYLKDIISVCTNCHKAIHIGKTNIDGNMDVALNWYSKVNEISLEETQQDLEYAFDIWRERSKYEWTQDKNMLKAAQEIVGIPDFDEPIGGKYYIHVDYEEKDIVKQLGARWDPLYKMWYYEIPNDRQKFIKWIPSQRIMV